MFFYPRWQLDASTLWQWLYPVGCVVALVGAWLVRHRTRAPLAALLLFGGTLLPALGFVNVYPFRFSYVADHFQYLAGIALITLVIGAVTHWVLADSGRRLRGGKVLAATLLLTLGILTFRRSAVFGKDDIHLMKVAVQQNPSAWIAWQNLGIDYQAKGDSVAALPYYLEALRVRPQLAEVRFEVAGLYYVWKRFPEAVKEYAAALRSDPGYAKGRFNFGAALYANGDRPAALAQFDTAAMLEQDSLVMQQRVAEIFLHLGDTARALSAARRAAVLQGVR